MLEIRTKRNSVLHTIAGAGLLLGLMSSPAFGQSDGEAASIKVGESRIIPSVRFEYLQTDNAFLDVNLADATEATAFVVKPRVNWVADRRLLTLTGIYEGNYASYSESALSFADHSLRAIVDAEVSSRTRLRGRFAFDAGHQRLGTSFTLGRADENTTQIEFLNTFLSGAYTYGAIQARGNLELGMSIRQRSYQNQSTLTSGAGYTLLTPYAQFSLRVSPDTRGIATLRFSSVNYGTNSRDRNDISLLTGLRFAATGKLGGEFQLGASFSNFPSANIDDQTSFVAEAELFFEPSVSSRFELSAARITDNDAANPLNTVLATTDEAELNWKHEWSSRFYHVADLSYRVENFECTNSSLTEFSGGIELNLAIRRWLHVGASFKGESRETTDCTITEFDESQFGFDAQTIGAHIRATL